jgi:hypothetical protein
MANVSAHRGDGVGRGKSVESCLVGEQCEANGPPKCRHATNRNHTLMRRTLFYYGELPVSLLGLLLATFMLRALR